MDAAGDRKHRPSIATMIEQAKAGASFRLSARHYAAPGLARLAEACLIGRGRLNITDASKLASSWRDRITQAAPGHVVFEM